MTELTVEQNTELAELFAIAQRRERLIDETARDGRMLVTIRKIDDLIPIPGADRIVTAQLGGWPSVVKNGEFQPGEMALFFEPDSFLDHGDERFAFLAPNKITWKGIEGIRLKSIKLRKQLSQGLCLPLALFPEVATLSEDGKTWAVEIGGGLTVNLPRFADRQSDEYDFVSKIHFTEVLGVIKWEKIERPGSSGPNAPAAGNFPTFLRKSDQPRCQGMVNEIFGYDQREVLMDADQQVAMPQEAIDGLIANGRARMTAEGLVRIYPPQTNRNQRYEISLKMDGSSKTDYINEGEAGVCSRNLALKSNLIVDEEGNVIGYENAGNHFVDDFYLRVKPLLELHGGNWAIQGEICGLGIQGDYEKVGATYGENRYYVYNVFDIDNNEFLLPLARREFMAKLNQLAQENGLDEIRHVPVPFFDVTLEELGITNIQELLAFAEGPGMLQGVREGYVFKAMDKPFQWKAISNAYLLGTDS